MAEAHFTDAIALLKADHRKVEDLFAQFEKSRVNKKAIAEQICNELKIHAQIEEEIFYPALSGLIQAETLNEAFVEHDGAKVLINDIVSGANSDEMLDAKLKVLSEDIKHHVREEEMPTEGMFAQAREAGVDLVALRDALLVRKGELMQDMQNRGLPPAEMRVLQG